MKNIAYVVLLCALACSSAPQNTDINAGFPLPVIPDTLTTPQSRADYLSLHYWDEVNLPQAIAEDTSLVVEQAFVDFINILYHTSDIKATRDAIGALLNKTAQDSISDATINGLAAKYLYETESPMLNEQLYAEFVQPRMLSLEPHSAERIRMADIMSQIRCNRPGSAAPDITVKTDAGNATISQLAAGLPILLLIYDHDCDLCHETIDNMVADQRLIDKLSEGRIKLIAVDTSTIPTTQNQKPIPGWIWASALGDIDEDFVYRSLPSIYVLSGDLKVLIKDSNYDLVSKSVFHD